MTDTMNKIKNNLKPSFHHPYLWVSVQKHLSFRGLYDTGADISCMSEKVFWQLSLNSRLKKLNSDQQPKFKSAGGQPLPVRGQYEFDLKVGNKTLTHQFYVIPDLNEPLILGIDFIQKYQLWYCPKNHSFAWEGQPNWGQGHLKVCNTTIILPLSVAYLKATIRTKGGTLPREGKFCIATVASSQHPLFTGGPYLVQPNTQGQITIAVKNCFPVNLELQQNKFIGSIENIQDCEAREVNPAYLQAVAQQHEAVRPRETLSVKKKQFIVENIKLQVPDQHQQQYMKLLLQNHEAVSQDKFNLGRTNTLMHEIALKTEEPIYFKQFKIPDAHRKEVE
jgi:hypothetical protein